MGIDIGKLEQQLDEEIADILENDTPRIQKQNLNELGIAIRVMCDTFCLLDKTPAKELYKKVQDAKKNINK